MKYESRITYHSRDMTNVNVFTDGQAKKVYAPDLSIRGHKKERIVDFSAECKTKI
jgi:hypothetical protein